MNFLYNSNNHEVQQKNESEDNTYQLISFAFEQ